MSKLSLDFLPGLKLNNPLLTASGCFGNSLSYLDYFDPNILGGTILKGLTLKPKDGNLGQRVTETASGMLNSVGLENLGYEKFVQESLPQIEAKVSIPVIANINGSTPEEYTLLAKKLEKHEKITALELNLSCPNVKSGGMSFGTQAKMVSSITAAVKQATSKPLIVKLTPNVTDLKQIVVAAQEGGADAISLINTLLGMAVDIHRKKPVLGNIFGGLSGPAIKPVGLRCVYQARQVTDLPIIGVGGIASAKDVLEYMAVGANAVSIGTMILSEPLIVGTILSDLQKYCQEQRLNNLQEIVGVCHR